MSVLSERWSARILPVLITLASGHCHGVLTPIEDDATVGIRKLALSSYYEREPPAVQPGCPITAEQDSTDLFDHTTSPIPRRFYRINAVR